MLSQATTRSHIRSIQTLRQYGDCLKMNLLEKRSWIGPVVTVIGCVVAQQVMAQALGNLGGDIATTVQQAGTWAITVARAAAVLIALAGFAMFATGRHAWQGGIVMLIGVAG